MAAGQIPRAVRESEEHQRVPSTQVTEPERMSLLVRQHEIGNGYRLGSDLHARILH